MIKPLTSLRFVFALMVFVSHIGFVQNNDSFLNWIYNLVLKEGYIGVSFFFILSGFIITYRYQEELVSKQTSKKSFYNARIARIVPLHIVTFLIAIPLTFFDFTKNKILYVTQILTNTTLTQSFIPNKHIYFSFNSPSWSISNEMFFYVLFPFLMVLIVKLRSYTKILLPLFLVIVPVLSFLIPQNYHHELFYINPFFRAVDFIIGILIYKVFETYKQTKINFTFIEFFAIILLLIFIALHHSIIEVARYSYYYWIPMGFLIFVFAFQKGSISKLLSHKFLMHLGHISFGFYLFHQLIIRYVLKINSKFFHYDNNFALIVFIFITTLIISHYSYIWIEKPMNKYLRFKLQKLNT